MTDTLQFAVKGLAVRPIPGERHRYFVQSSRPGEPEYMVDVEARFPMGRCVCRNYECVRWPEFKRTLLADTCKHVKAAMLYHALRCIREASPHLNGDGE